MQLKQLPNKIKSGIIKALVFFLDREFPIPILRASRFKPKTDITDSEEAAKKFLNWVGAGLIVISLVLLQGLITSSALDAYQFISLICFSVSIPLLAGIVTIFNIELINKKSSIRSTIFLVLYLFSLLLTVAGIDLIFWHFTWIAGLLFLITSLFIGALTQAYYLEDDEITNKNEEWD